MNPQTAHPDEALDRILAALREAQPSRGLEQRIRRNIARAAEARAVTPSFFAVILNAVKAPPIVSAETRLYLSAATASAVLITAWIVSFSMHSKPDASTRRNPLPAFTEAQTPTHPETLGVSQRSVSTSPTGRTNAVDRRDLPASVPPQPESPPTPDPDTLALAETLAPSLAAPRMPLTAEEHLLITATRQGQPIELAELDILRQPALQAAAAANERITIRNYIHSLLGPLAAVEAMNPTPPSPSLSESRPAFDPPSSK